MDLNFDSMSVGTCAALAQIMPVFVVALVAERIAFRRSLVESDARALIVLVRILVDFSLAIGLLGVTFLALQGIEHGGITGRAAQNMWTVSCILGFAIVYRWVLLSTPILPVITYAAQIATGKLAAKLARGPEWLSRVLIDLVEAAATVLTVGLFSGVDRLSNQMAENLERMFVGVQGGVERLLSSMTQPRRQRSRSRGDSGSGTKTQSASGDDE